MTPKRPQEPTGGHTMHVIARKPKLNRRKLLSILAASPLLASKAAQALEPGVRQGKLRQSVMTQVWGQLRLSIQERCEVLAALGFSGMDLPQPADIPVLQEYNLTPVLMTGTGTSFDNGLIRTEVIVSTSPSRTPLSRRDNGASSGAPASRLITVPIGTSSTAAASR